MTLPSIQGKELDLLRFMKQNGYSVFHLSNIFLRDFQYGVRDYFRATIGKDIGSRGSDALAAQAIAALEKEGILLPSMRNTWLLHREEFLNQPKEPATQEAAA